MARIAGEVGTAQDVVRPYASTFFALACSLDFWHLCCFVLVHSTMIRALEVKHHVEASREEDATRCRDGEQELYTKESPNYVS